MMLTEQDLTDLEIADAVGDFGRDSKVTDAVEELRALRATLRSVRDALPMVGADPEVARAVREDIDRALGPKVAALECSECGHAFAGGTHDPQKGCGVIVARELETHPVQFVEERCGCMGAP